MRKTACRLKYLLRDPGMCSKGGPQSARFELIYSVHQWQTVATTNNHWEAQTMQETENATLAVMEQQITERYG